MENVRKRTTALVKIAMIGAIYTVISVLILPLAFGPMQLRVSEMLTVLPAFTFLGIPGLTLGCCLTNLIGAMTGANPLGYVDAVVGSCATLIAGVLSYLIAKKSKSRLARYLLVPLPPVLVNAVIIGFELMVLYSEGAAYSAVFPVMALSVGVEQLIICYGLGVPFMILMDRTGLGRKIFS